MLSSKNERFLLYRAVLRRAKLQKRFASPSARFSHRENVDKLVRHKDRFALVVSGTERAIRELAK
jgi:hypothetical protein